MTRRTKAILGTAGLLAAMQLYRPARTNPPIDPKQEIGAVLHVDPAAQAILDRSCRDCHSNRTVWPTYSEIAPISWLVADDVNSGRRHMNFSDWGTYPPYKQLDLLNEICKIVTQRDMPPFSYNLIHGTARLSQPDRDAICAWTRKTINTYAKPADQQLETAPSLTPE